MKSCIVQCFFSFCVVVFSTCGAAAWVLEVGRAGKFKVLASRGLFIEGPTSSFTAEALALESAINYVKALVLESPRGQH